VSEHLFRAKQVLEKAYSLRNETEVYQEIMQSILYKFDVYPFPLPLWGDGAAFHVNVFMNLDHAVFFQTLCILAQIFLIFLCLFSVIEIFQH